VIIDAIDGADVQIVTCHSLHGPQVSPTGQPLVLDFFYIVIKSLDLDAVSGVGCGSGRNETIAVVAGTVAG
jgi:hypothetical protein